MFRGNVVYGFMMGICNVIFFVECIREFVIYKGDDFEKFYFVFLVLVGVVFGKWYFCIIVGEKSCFILIWFNSG